MRRRTLTLVTLLTLTTAAAGCNTPSYPLDELDSSDVNHEALAHFKTELAESGLFPENSRFAIEVGAHSGNWCATVYVLDYTGREVSKLFTADDELETDMVSAICDGMWGNEYDSDFYYDYHLEVIDDHIYGERLLPTGWEDKMFHAKEQLVNAGYPDLSFHYEDSVFFYGDFTISGDLAEDMLQVALGRGGIYEYRFKDSYGTLLSERIY